MGEPYEITPESPERLRDCLTALSAAAGTDVHRCEVRLIDGSGLRIIITSSRKESEAQIAKLIGEKLEALFVEPEAKNGR
jgi:hypothetical protein